MANKVHVNIQYEDFIRKVFSLVLVKFQRPSLVDTWLEFRAFPPTMYCIVDLNLNNKLKLFWLEFNFNQTNLDILRQKAFRE